MAMPAGDRPDFVGEDDPASCNGVIFDRKAGDLVVAAADPGVRLLRAFGEACRRCGRCSSCYALPRSRLPAGSASSRWGLCLGASRSRVRVRSNSAIGLQSPPRENWFNLPRDKTVHLSKPVSAASAIPFVRDAKSSDVDQAPQAGERPRRGARSAVTTAELLDVLAHRALGAARIALQDGFGDPPMLEARAPRRHRRLQNAVELQAKDRELRLLDEGRQLLVAARLDVQRVELLVGAARRSDPACRDPHWCSSSSSFLPRLCSSLRRERGGVAFEQRADLVELDELAARHLADAGAAMSSTCTKPSAAGSAAPRGRCRG